MYGGLAHETQRIEFAGAGCGRSAAGLASSASAFGFMTWVAGFRLMQRSS
jgi:hypothetical protein